MTETHIAPPFFSNVVTNDIGCIHFSCNDAELYLHVNTLYITMPESAFSYVQ